MLPPTDRQQQTSAFGNLRWRKRGPTNNASGKSKCLIYPSCSLRKWRPRQGGNEFLQALGLQASREVGPFLQPDHELVAMHLGICSTPLRNSVRSGCSLHSWPCRPRPAFCLWIWHQPRPTFDLASYRFSCIHFTPILFPSYLVQ